MKPAPGDDSPPLEWVIQKPKEVGRTARGEAVFEWTLVGVVGDKTVAKPRQVWSVEPPGVDTGDGPATDYGSHFMRPPAYEPLSSAAGPSAGVTRAPSLGGADSPPRVTEGGKVKTRGIPEDQLSDIGRDNPTPLTPEELARIETYQAERNAYLKRWRELDRSGYPPPTQDLLFGKADRAIRGNMTPDDLSAVIKERRGDVIRKQDGSAFDHIGEYRMARRAVLKALVAIEQRLKLLETQGAVPGETDILETKRGELSRLLGLYVRMAGGLP